MLEQIQGTCLDWGPLMLRVRLVRPASVMISFCSKPKPIILPHDFQNSDDYVHSRWMGESIKEIKLLYIIILVLGHSRQNVLFLFVRFTQLFGDNWIGILKYSRRSAAGSARTKVTRCHKRKCRCRSRSNILRQIHPKTLYLAPFLCL